MAAFNDKTKERTRFYGHSRIYHTASIFLEAITGLLLVTEVFFMGIHQLLSKNFVFKELDFCRGLTCLCRTFSSHFYLMF